MAWSAWSKEGSERRRRGSGQPKISNERQEKRFRRLASVNPFETTRSVGLGKTGVYANSLSQNPFVSKHHTDQLIVPVV
jgi:hypothetical protein